MKWLLTLVTMMHVRQLGQWLQEMHGRRLRLQPRPKLLAAPALSPDHAALARILH
jgi:hypothetical protein